MKIILATLIFCATLSSTEPNTSEIPLDESKILVSDWKYMANFANVEFYMGYGISKSSVRIKAVNKNAQPITIKVHVSGGGEEKEMTFYSIKPGSSETNVFVASLIDNKYAHIKSVSIELLSAN